jgi:preprotein translocase subunit SecE
MFGKLRKFYVEVLQEFSKIVWPKKNELISTTLVVIFAVLLFSFLFLTIDYIVHYVIKIILKIGKDL